MFSTKYNDIIRYHYINLFPHAIKTNLHPKA